MTVTRALSEKERFDRLVDEVASSVFIDAGMRTGEPEDRLLAIKHAIRVNRKRDGQHGFGKYVVDKVIAGAMPDYVSTCINVPALEATSDKVTTRLMSEEGVRVLRTVMEAVGMEESQEDGVFPGVIINHALRPFALYMASEPYAVDFDHSVPGVAYVETATDVIAWDRQATLAI